ncbi:YdiU family protein [Alphaproteobacteria bacterium]|nr:YdiU family protein [Alphaproteobacteria bacterium]
MKQSLELYQPYKDLNAEFYEQAEPAIFPFYKIRYKNINFPEFINLEDKAWIDLFGKFKSNFLPENHNLALKYHGHQFQTYNPELGDGRGFTIAQFYHNNKLLDLGTKGSGRTKFSRSGDGRLTLKGAVREVLCSEYLHALGVNTSRSISLIETGENLYRNDEPSPSRSAVLVRASHSHIRIGSFQYQAYHRKTENLEKLIGYVCKNYFNLKSENNQKLEFFNEVVERLAMLAASYTVTGFVHGVLNTDNMNITGESFDYGPYRMLEHYDLEKIAAYFDHSGLYKYGNQANAIFWNIQQLASIMTTFITKEQLVDMLKQYADLYNQNLQILTFKRLNIFMKSDSENLELLNSFYELQTTKHFFYEEIFYDFKNFPQNYDYVSKKYSSYTFLKEFKKFQQVYEVNSVNEKFIRLFYDDIENIWNAINDEDDWSLFDKKIKSINNIREY